MAIKTHKVTLSLDNPRVIQSGINVQSFDKQSIQISIELTKNDEVFQVPSDATIRVSLLKLARQEQKIIVDVPNTNRDSIDWIVPDYLDGYQGTVRVGVYLVSGTENVDLGYFTILSNVSDIDKMADEFTDNVFQGWEQIEADLNELNLTIAQTKLDLADDLTQIDNTIASINTLASDFTADVATKQSDVTSKYNAFDASVTTANQTIDEILALQPQFQSVLDETTGKDVISAPELIAARNGESNLKARLDKEHQEVTAQLAQTEHYMNQLQNVFMGKGLEPYWIETAVEFGFTLGGVPEGVNNYEGGNYYLGISGSEGDSFVTVTSGDITHSGEAISWACVIKDDLGNWKPYRVLGTDGVDQVNIYPPLKTNISNGELANVHDAKVGQHYTERGYFALAQHIYNYSPFYANRNKVISKFNPRTDSIEENKWDHVDVDRTPAFSTQSITTPQGLLSTDTNNVLLVSSTAGRTMESNYEVDVSGKKGYVETHIYDSVYNLKADFYLDDVLVQSYDTETSVVNKLKFSFDNAKKAKLSIYAPNTTAFASILIGRTTWYEVNESAQQILPPHSRVVYLGDSWGEFHNRAITRELSRLLSRDSGTAVDVFNDSKGGMTSKWGMAWFEEYVIKNRPTHVIIEFFTNDLNAINNSLLYNYLAPDGQTYSGKIASREEWLNNIKQMANISKRYGIQPIIVAPALVEGDSQILSHLTASNLMFD